jgi:hypothetical protein
MFAGAAIAGSYGPLPARGDKGLDQGIYRGGELSHSSAIRTGAINPSNNRQSAKGTAMKVLPYAISVPSKWSTTF